MLHTPDGIPDIVQQIAHGVEALLPGYRVAGHSFAGIIEGSLRQYVHLGDAATMTDNRIYDSTLRPGEMVGGRSGTMDDRWVFTSRDTGLEYRGATALAAASRVLRGYEDALAEECLQTAVGIWDYEQTHEPVKQRSAYVPGSPEIQEVLAAVELLITTGETRYGQRLVELWPVIHKNIAWVGWSVTRVLSLIEDVAFAHNLHAALEDFKAALDADLSTNPFGVPFHPHRR